MSAEPNRNEYSYPYKYKLTMYVMSELFRQFNKGWSSYGAFWIGDITNQELAKIIDREIERCGMGILGGEKSEGH